MTYDRRAGAGTGTFSQKRRLLKGFLADWGGSKLAGLTRAATMFGGEWGGSSGIEESYRLLEKLEEDFQSWPGEGGPGAVAEQNQAFTNTVQSMVRSLERKEKALDAVQKSLQDARNVLKDLLALAGQPTER